MRRLCAILIFLSQCPLMGTETSPAPSVGSPIYWLRRGVSEGFGDGKTELSDDASIAIALAATGLSKLDDQDGLRQMAQLQEKEVTLRKDALRRTADWLQIAEWRRATRDEVAANEALTNAIESSQRIQDNEVRTALQIQAARLRQALAAKSGIVLRPPQDPVKRAEFYCALALESHRVLDKAGFEKNVAAAMANAASAGKSADSVYARVCDLYSRIGDFAGAAKCVGQISDPGERSSAWLRMADYQHRAKDKAGYRQSISAALSDAQKIAPALERTSALNHVSGAQVEFDEKEAARQTLKLARTAADSIAKISQRSTFYGVLAATYAKIGDADAAMELLQRSREIRGFKGPDLAEDELAEIGKYLGEARKPELAGALAARITDLELRSKVHLGIVLGHLRAGKITEAREAHKLIRTPTQQAESCRAIGMEWGKLRSFEQIDQWIKSLSSTHEKAAACVGVAEGMMGRKVVEDIVN